MTTSTVAQQPRHILERATLVLGQALDPQRRDLVEYAIQLVATRLAGLRREAWRRRLARHDSPAALNDLVGRVLALASARLRLRNGTRRVFFVGHSRNALT